jgi:hypothetical protein
MFYLGVAVVCNTSTSVFLWGSYENIYVLCLYMGEGHVFLILPCINVVQLW